MSLKYPLSALVLALLALPALAQDPQPLTYAMFEAAVPHVDLETCPDSLPQQDSFCRASVKHSEIHVFAFSEYGDSPMIGFASFPADQLGLLLK
ncbi:hypothetical protein E1B25_17770 [Antarcticimicrobium sediminis]|uniref:Uncharacterized protein n=1 Tax=Antarcticimicrobium sediminis TaxID=2546227 RepID=A0A4R5EL36_9RHOB|nr:hypothetical protein E1B25_17770 [Antarcticimicrobium sediminis]